MRRGGRGGESRRPVGREKDKEKKEGDGRYKGK